MEPLKFNESDELRFVLRWSEVTPETQTTIFALLCLVPLGLILWLYRYEMQLVTRRTAISLLLLRTLVIGLILFLVCAQPIFVHTDREKLPSRILIAVDLSESMDLTD